MSKQECVHGFEEGCIRCAMSDPGYTTPVTLVALVVDASSSMNHRLRETLSGLNEYIDGLRQHEGIQYLVSLSTFNYHANLVINSTPLQEVDKITQHQYKVGGNTALYDAVAETALAVEKELVKYPGASVLFVVLTDGEENASYKFDKKKINEIISRTTKTGNWTYAFIGCDIENWNDSKALSVPANNNLSVNSANYGSTFSKLSKSTRRYAVGRRAAGTIMSTGDTSLTRSVTSYAVNDFFDDAADADTTVTPDEPPTK